VPSLTLKVDVDTLRGTLEGVPRLVELFQRHRTDATFLFSPRSRSHRLGDSASVPARLSRQGQADLENKK
jgi:hypothetical protein